MSTHETRTPPMDPDTSEADRTQLEFARVQGDAYGRALAHMVQRVANDGGTTEAGDYIIGYAIEEAEGMYEWTDGELTWRDPEDENLHVEVSVRDRADGRFVPGLRVIATLTAPDRDPAAPVELPLLWHPMIYHYGRNVSAPSDGRYTLAVHVDPPTFARHDEVNGRRFVEPVEVEFRDVQVTRGRD
jgi:Fe2+ transport protein